MFHNRNFCFSIGLAATSGLWGVCAGAQVPGAAKATSSRPVAAHKTSKSANVQTGTLGTLDASAGILSLQGRPPEAAPFHLTSKTRYYKQQRTAKSEDFSPGETVYVHLRHSHTDETYQVIELADPISWKWLTDLRREITAATLTEVTEDTLSVTLGKKALPFTYSLSDNTVWHRGGKTAAKTDFKPGDAVIIVPRSLPSGNVMAYVVSDSTADALQGKEERAVSVYGRLKALDPAAHTLTLWTEAGEMRQMSYEAATEVRQGSKTRSQSALKIGQAVGVRLRHDENDHAVVWRITIDPPRHGVSKSRKRSGADSILDKIIPAPSGAR